MTKVIFNADSTVKLGRKTYKVSEAIDHAVIVYDEMQLLQLKKLDYMKEIGTILLQLRALKPSDKEFGQAVAATDLSKIAYQDRNDAMFIATHWTTVQKLNKSNKLDSLGVSSIRKKVTEALRAAGKMKPKQSKTADQPKADKVLEPADGKAKTTSWKDEVAKLDKVSTLIEPTVQTEADLAQLVYKLATENGLDFSIFAKELTKIRKGA